jgi:DNA repair ATPase RecN
MSNNTLTVVAAIVGALGGLSGLAAVITALTKRRTVNADAEVRLSDEARQWVEQFQEDAKEAKQEARDARAEATAARREAAETHSQMRAIRVEAEWLARQLQELHRAILDPNATVERLRAMVGPQPGNNVPRP